MPRGTALNLLTRREHSRAELERKLGRKGFLQDAVEAVLDALDAEGLQSDARFTEAYVRWRHGRGYGPRRILAELRERGISGAFASSFVDTSDPVWIESSRAAHVKKFGAGPSAEPSERARQTRYLEYRGFTHEQIRAALSNREHEDS
jgi:regulatory protein